MWHDDEDEPYVVIEKRESSLGSFFIGAAVGAAVALLFAPRSGEETRAEKTGVGFDYLLATAQRESALDPSARSTPVTAHPDTRIYAVKKRLADE